eukprot:SAG11_NODE_588_length_8329_cov_18.642857_7_plen_206_part_00
MGLAILMKQALSEGVSAESVEATQETDEPKSQVVELLVQARMAAEAKLALPEEVEPEPDVEALFARPDQPRSSSSYDAAAVEREAVAVVAAERVVDREEEVAQQAVATLETERAIAAALAAQRAEEMLRELDVARSGEMRCEVPACSCILICPASVYCLNINTLTELCSCWAVRWSDWRVRSNKSKSWRCCRHGWRRWRCRTRRS